MAIWRSGALGAFLGLLSAGLVAAEPVQTPVRGVTNPARLVSPIDPRGKPVPLEALFRSVNSSAAVWSADGRSVIHNVLRATGPNVVSQDLAGHPPTSIASFPGRTGGLHVSADGAAVLFQGDLAGHEISDIYLAPLDGGAWKNLTQTDDVNEAWPLPSPDGRTLFFSSRRKTESFENIVAMDLATGARRPLTAEATSGVQWMAVAISADGRTLLANRYDFSFAFSEAYSIDVASGRATQLTPASVYGSITALSPDGRLAAVTIETAGVRQAAVLDLETKALTFCHRSAWEQRTTSFSPDGRKLLFVTNEDSREYVSVYDLAAKRAQQLNLPLGVNGLRSYQVMVPSFAPDGKRILFSHMAGGTPQDFWVYDLARRRSRKITTMGRLDDAVPPHTQIVHYRSFDGTLISAVVWMPYNLRRDGSAPAVVVSHGGPTEQQQDMFDAFRVALASRGYVVISPNFRGSLGFGQAFTNANRLDIGDGDLKDVIAAADFLKATGYVDTRRIGMIGGSYGGYMTLMALSKAPHVFAAGVEMFGITNWRSMWERGAPQNRRYQAGLLGTPQDNPGGYDRASPLTFLDRLEAPLLVLHGENDPRVPAFEAQQVVDALKARGRVVEAHIYPGEGHGFIKPENQREALQRAVDWFDRFLKPATAPPGRSAGSRGGQAAQ